MSKLPTHATCCHCKQRKAIKKLNGYDPITGDTSRAYCKNLTECNSNFAHGQIANIVAALAPA